MKKIFTGIAAASFFAISSTFTAFADDLESISGKWSLKKTVDGQSITQAVEIKKDKFKFSIKNSDGKTVLYAEGSIKLETLSPFKSIKFFDMKAGESAGEIQSVDEVRQGIYQVGDGTWTLASNFDAERDQKATVDVYSKVTN